MKTDGIHLLKEKLVQIPTRPGVYRMLNAVGDVLYVGKAKNLKNRLAQYAQGTGLPNRIRKMVFETADLIVVETATEAEALLLEISLIKSLKPRYNITFRDDTSYPYILITDEATPQVRYHRGAKKFKGQYFGPYPSAQSVHAAIDVVERVFHLRTCKSSVFNNRTRPCLKYDIKRCSAPCVGRISSKSYTDSVHQAELFLHGKRDLVQKGIQEKMAQAAADMRYEDAAKERDRLQALAAIAGRSSALGFDIKDADIFGVYASGGAVCVQLFSYRGGQHVGNAVWFPAEVESLTLASVLKYFLALYYEKSAPPKEIYCADLPEDAEFLQQALSAAAGYKVLLSAPRRGDKRKLVNQATENARANLERKLAEKSSWRQQMRAFAKILDLDDVARVECFDISNISGKQAVASLVVAGEEGMLKNDYRKFSIKGQDTPDDYAMMREALHRRYGRLKAEDGSVWPDVVMVDGGKGHLTQLVRIFDELELLNDPVCPVLCAIAKGPERDKGLELIYQYGRVDPLPVAHNTPLIFLLQRVRDEAHRFAITFHRQKRSKSIGRSLLDAISGVGAKRKKALLLKFGSPEGVRAASVDELAQVEGVSQKLAQQIYDELH